MDLLKLFRVFEIIFSNQNFWAQFIVILSIPWGKIWVRLVQLFGRLYPIATKTAKPIGLKFCVGPRMTSEKVYGCSELQKVVSKSF